MTAVVALCFLLHGQPPVCRPRPAAAGEHVRTCEWLARRVTSPPVPRAVYECRGGELRRVD